MATPPPIHKQASKNEDLEILPVEVGQTIWVPGQEQVWDRATVMAIGGLKVTVRTAAGKVQQVDRGLALPQNPRVADDMTALYYIHEPGVLHNLAERSKLQGPEGGNGEQKPYTFMANVLIAVNPLRELPHPRVSEIVSNAGGAPHPFAIAEMAYQQMVFNSGTEQPTNQSVVISGESGAGKTESSKIVLRHLTTRGLYGKNAKPQEIEAKYAADHKSGAYGSSLDARLIEQNPILEAFGNAKTLRNHNSSRFGKFMKLQFTNDSQFKLAGAFVETYLLEKSRLVYQVDGERNFHIFYQLLAGASPAMKSQLKITKPQDYDYLNQSGCYVAEDTDDKADFEAVVRGLSCVGMDDNTQSVVFSVIAGLLHLGNVDLDEEDTAEGEAAVIDKPSAKQALVLASQLLGVTEAALARVIIERDIVTRDETFTVRRNGQNAIYARDAIAKALYGKLFDWVIEQVNKSLGQDPAPLPYIGVLDIFGFESFQRNDYEQLLINYTNEVLQATFNNQVFIAEMELYKREGITVGKIQWPDNRECVELIAGKPDGILALLDAEAMNPKPGDDKFLAALHRKHAKNPYFPRPHPKDMQANFIVRHFAGAVSYTVGQFIDKNNDSIPQDMTNLFLGSSNSLVTSLFKNVDGEDSRPGKKRVLKSVAAKFSRQMQELVDTLDATRCNFIRCIKPNALMRVGIFDGRYVVGQLRCQGIMQTAQVLKVGLPTRVPYSELVTAYKKYMPPDAQRLFANQSDPTLITAILWAFQVPMDAYKLGITRLFFKAGKIALLDAILKINWAVDGPRIVARMKLWLARRRWRVALAKVVSQNNFRRLLRKIQARRDAIVRIQQWWRGLGIRRQFKKTKSAAVVMQALFRGYTARRQFKTKKQELLAIAAARAEEARRHAEEAKRREEQARLAADMARRESMARATAEEDRRRMEEEANRAEQEAMRYAQEAAAAVREADLAAAEAANAVEQERQAELRAIAEARELEIRMAHEREEAERRKEEALLRAASVSANLLGGLAQVQTMNGANGEVSIVEIPDDVTQENREQLLQLNELLLNGAISQGEYDELVPFLLEKPVDEPTGAVLTAEQEESLTRLYSAGVYGVQIRCPACGATNNTANGNHCESCGSLLTTSDESAAAHDPSYYGYRQRSMSRGALSTLTAPVGSFGMDGHRITIHDGYFQAQMNRTQVLQDDNYAEYTVYVLRCQWQPKEGGEPTAWLVSHRFSVFERLHKDLKHKIPPTVATLPNFPRKHRLGGVFGGKTGNSTEIVEERKRGLESYVGQVLDICARLPDTLTVPELDRFLNVSRQVEQFRRHLAAAAASAAGAMTPDGSAMPAQYQGPSSGAEALAAREQARLPTELPTPLDEEELTQTEQAVALLNASIRNARGDLRRDNAVQHHLKVCVQLLPRLQISANLDNPFANVDLIPRAMQCQEDLEMTMNLYNDSLLAVSETYALSAQEAGGSMQVPPPYVPGQQNSYQRSYGV